MLTGELKKVKCFGSRKTTILRFAKDNSTKKEHWEIRFFHGVKLSEAGFSRLFYF